MPKEQLYLDLEGVARNADGSPTPGFFWWAEDAKEHFHLNIVHPDRTEAHEWLIRCRKDWKDAGGSTKGGWLTEFGVVTTAPAGSLHITKDDMVFPGQWSLMPPEKLTSKIRRAS